MVLKKLGDELHGHFVDVVRYLGEECGVRVLVEPNEYTRLVSKEEEPALLLPVVSLFLSFGGVKKG